MMNYHPHIFNHVAEMMLNDVIYSENQVFG